jgi:hypothetical protein
MDKVIWVLVDFITRDVWKIDVGERGLTTPLHQIRSAIAPTSCSLPNLHATLSRNT